MPRGPSRQARAKEMQAERQMGTAYHHLVTALDDLGEVPDARIAGVRARHAKDMVVPRSSSPGNVRLGTTAAGSRSSTPQMRALHDLCAHRGQPRRRARPDRGWGSAGFGLRFRLAEQNRMNYRSDVAWGRDGFEFYFSTTEAF